MNCQVHPSTLGYILRIARDPSGVVYLSFPFPLSNYCSSLSADAHMDTIMVQNDVLDTARDEGIALGLEKGRAEGIASVARNLVASGMDMDMICSVTKLSKEAIEAIRKEMN